MHFACLLPPWMIFPDRTSQFITHLFHQHNLQPLPSPMGCFFVLLFFSVSPFETNSSNAPPPLPESTSDPLNPAIVITVGTLTVIFSITSILLLYAKHCKSAAINSSPRVPPVVSRESSGIHRKVIESLPLFRFSSLRGHKDGLECAVCLDKFKPDEILRLLPRCKHAFHVECVDTWLEENSNCPLCRYRVHLEDILLVDYGEQSSRALYSDNQIDQQKGKEILKSRISGRHSSAGERGNSLEIIVENPGGNSSRGRVSLDSSSYKKMMVNLVRRPPWLENFSRKDMQLAVQADRHRIEHRIILAGSGEEEEELLRRWSDVHAAEILFLKSEMILVEENSRQVKNERSASEITGVSRFRYNNGGRDDNVRQKEGAVKRWLDWISQSKQQQKPEANSAAVASVPSNFI